MQVKNLRPGRQYAYRIGVQVRVVPPLAEPPEQPPSAEVIFETPATPPVAPQPPTTWRTERTSLGVMVAPAPCFLCPYIWQSLALRRMHHASFSVCRVDCSPEHNLRWSCIGGVIKMPPRS